MTGEGPLSKEVGHVEAMDLVWKLEIVATIRRNCLHKPWRTVSCLWPWMLDFLRFHCLLCCGDEAPLSQDCMSCGLPPWL